MAFLIALILAAAVTAFAIREAEPPVVPAAREREEVSVPGAPLMVELDDSPLLQTTVIEHADIRTQRLALFRLVGGIAASGVGLGFAIVIVAKVLGILLRHFAQGS